MSTSTIDYDALAAQNGGTPHVDYDALAAQYGGTVQGTAPAAPTYLHPNPGKPLSAAHSDSPGFLSAMQKSFDESVQHNPSDSAFTSGVKTVAGDVGGIVAHPLNAIASMGKTLFPLSVGPGGQVDMAPSQGAQQLAATQQDFAQNGVKKGLADVAGHAVAMGAMAGAGGGMVDAAGMIPEAGAAIREAALGDPDAAALKGLGVSPKSPKALQTLSAVQGAKPFLEGVKGLQDLQERVPAAKQEIWQPYQDALAKVGNKQVKGPDGNMTTVQALEDRRLELSAQLRTLRKGGPEAFTLAQQKGLTQAALLREESQIKATIDPQLRQAGIDPVAIRKAFGQVSQVGSKVAGKTTVGQEDQPYGVARLQNFQLTKPLANLKDTGAALRDIAAGRYWSQNPTDLNIREAFRQGGPKPNFAVPVQPQPNMAGMLPATTGGPIELPYVPEMSAGEKSAALMQQLRQAAQKSLPASAGPGAATILPYSEPMSGGEQIAALMHYLRTHPQKALPAKVTAIPLPPGS